MDSGNSGSMQSSSGGDEEYDSRPHSSSLSPFFNPSTHFGNSISNPQQQPPPSPHPPTFFDPSSHNNNLDAAFSHSQSNPLYNLDFWSKNLRSDQPNFTDLVNPKGQSSSSMSVPLRVPQKADQTNVVKNPKKRTRASRRAPTTVLTTDTTNFRQMVQEFTGIPAAPFSAASPYSRRLDLFGAGSLGPLYPLRPSAQKVQPSPYLSSSSSSVSFFNSCTMVDSLPNTTTNIASTTNNFTHSQNMLNMQNPILTFQSLLQSQPTFGTKSLDDLGMSNQHVNNANLSGFQSHENSDGMRGDHHQEHFGSFNGKNGVNPQNVQPDQKGMENIVSSSRGEGTVDSWICPSD